MTILLLASLLLTPSTDGGVHAWCLARLLEPFCAVVDDSGRTVVYYGDEGGRLHRLDDRTGALRETKQVGVTSAVRALEAADLDGNGAVEVVIVTADGELSICDGASLAVLWRSHDERFGSVEALALANVDRDPSLEILLLADERLVVFDGTTHFREWASPDAIAATDLLVADVDGDGELEIVLSSGLVLSALFFQTEWDAGEPFGKELLLLDLQGDPTPELVARREAGTVRIFSIKDRREIW